MQDLTREPGILLQRDVAEYGAIAPRMRMRVVIDGRDHYCSTVVVYEPSEMRAPTTDGCDSGRGPTMPDLAPGTLVEYRQPGHNFDGLVLEVIERNDDGDSSTGPWYRCLALCADDAGWPVRRPVAGIHGSRLYAAPDGTRFGDDVGQVRKSAAAAGDVGVVAAATPAPALTRPLEPGDLAVVRRTRDLWNGHVVRVLPLAGSDEDEPDATHLLVQAAAWSGPVKMWINRANLELAPDGAEYGDCS